MKAPKQGGIKLNRLAPARGAKKHEKRIGCGPGSGHGKTATKGHKGQAARSGGTKHPGFEGGQQPLIRRVPKVGFISIFRKRYAIVNLDALKQFESGAIVTPEILHKAGLIRNLKRDVKILGEGDIAYPLLVSAHAYSQSALQKIQAVGGTTETLRASQKSQMQSQG